MIGSTISSQRQPSISVRTKEIRLVRDVGSGSGGDGYGITLRGGGAGGGSGGDLNAKNGRPFVITFVKPNSPAER